MLITSVFQLRLIMLVKQSLKLANTECVIIFEKVWDFNDYKQSYNVLVKVHFVKYIF